MRGWGGFASDGPSDVTEMARVFNDVFTKEVHREAVRGALSEGKPVPPEVLADYPDLAPSAAQPTAVATEQTAPVATRAPATRYKQSTLPPENYDDYSWMNKYPQPKEPWQMTNAEIQKLWDNRPTVDEGESMDWSGWRHISVGTYGKTSSGVPAQYAISPDGYWYEYDHNSHGYYPITHGGEFSKDLHEMDVRAALKEGKPVPAEVLAEYPELQQPLKSGGKLEISNGEQAIHTTPSPSPSLSPSPAVTATAQTVVPTVSLPKDLKFGGWQEKTGKVGYHGEEVPVSYRTSTKEVALTVYKLNGSSRAIPSDSIVYEEETGNRYTETARAIEIKGVPYQTVLIQRQSYFHDGSKSGKPWYCIADANTGLAFGKTRESVPSAVAEAVRGVERAKNNGTDPGKVLADAAAKIGKRNTEIAYAGTKPSPTFPAVTQASPAPATVQNAASQQGLNTTSDYVMDVSPQSMAAQADRQLNGSREGYVTLNTLNPVHWVNELVKNDPLAKGLDKIGLYTLLYGKEEMAAIRAGRGNPSLFAMRPVPNVVKRNFIWGYGFSPDTLDEMKDVRVRARTMYGKLAELEDQTIKFGKDQFLAMIRFISGFPTGKNTALATSAGKPADPALLPAYDLAEQWGKLEEWLAYNLIHDGQIDPNVFGRLAGRYIPAPYDRMGQMLRPLEEAEHVRPSLVFLKHQSMTPDQIIAFASQGDNWEKYRAFFFQRMRSEIRAAEKGGVFNAIAADPKSGIMPPELAPKKGYVEVDDAMNAFGLKGAAVPQWVADFIHNEFIDVQVAQQLQGYSEVLGWYKFLRVGANIPTFIRNVVSQLTVQMLEGNVGPLDLEHYLIKPMGVLLGMDKAGKQELVAMGLWDNNIAREMEGLQFTPEEKALWNTGDRTVAITAFVNRIKNFRSRASSIYGLSDAYTKAATYFANKDEYGARGARNIAFLTSGDYTSRPPIVNFLSRGTRKGKVNPLMFLISNPFAFYRTVVEPQRVGYDLVHHPSLVVGAVAAAYFVIKGVAKRVAKEYDISEEQAAGLITELQNYEWLKGRAVLPISGEQAIDLTDLIPMVSYLTTFQQELASHEDLFREIFKWGGLLFGSNNPNFVLNIIATWVTGNDFAAEWRYGRTYRVGDTTWAKLKWTAKQLLPSWITRTLENTKTGNFSITDIIGSYIATASDEDKINFYNSLRKNPQYDAKELNRIYNALFKGTSLTGK